MVVGVAFHESERSGQIKRSSTEVEKDNDHIRHLLHCSGASHTTHYPIPLKLVSTRARCQLYWGWAWRWLAHPTAAPGAERGCIVCQPLELTDRLFTSFVSAVARLHAPPAQNSPRDKPNTRPIRIIHPHEQQTEPSYRTWKTGHHLHTYTSPITRDNA